MCNLYDKKEYVVHIRALKQALNHGLILKKVHRVIHFNQEAWLKPYIEMNTNLRTKLKNDFEKEFFKLKNNSVFGKTMENERKHRDIKLATTDKRINRLVSDTNYYTTKWFSQDLLAIQMKKVKMKINKPVYLGFSITEISKTLMCEFRCDYIKPKKMQNYVIWILTALLLILKLKMFIKILQMILKKDMIHQFMKFIDHHQKE